MLPVSVTINTQEEFVNFKLEHCNLVCEMKTGIDGQWYVVAPRDIPMSDIITDLGINVEIHSYSGLRMDSVLSCDLIQELGKSDINYTIC